MARKPNYQFERLERERAKAAKLADKAKLKREEKERGQPQETDSATGPADPEQ